MKTLFKISSGIVLASLVAVPLLAFAAIDSGPCCLLKAKIDPTDLNIRLKDGSVRTAVIEANSAVGSSAEGSCSLKTTLDIDTPQWGMLCLMSTIYGITNWIFIVLMALVVVMVIIGGFFMVTSAGNEESFKKGRTMITFAIIGLIVALLAKWVPSLVRFVVG